jgi:hypothetical protein
MRKRMLTTEELEALGFETVNAKVDQALDFLLEHLQDGAWHDSAPIHVLATERGIKGWALREAGDYVVEYARTPTKPSRTLWRSATKWSSGSRSARRSRTVTTSRRPEPSPTP